jgi:hypothetical protein
MQRPDELYLLEEQIRRMHVSPAVARQSTADASGEGSLVKRRLSAFFQPLFARTRSGGGGREWTRDAVQASTQAILNAVADGQLSPKAAESLLRCGISTQALLQSVAGGEISPRTAQRLLLR